MTLNNLDTWFSSSKMRSVLTFLTFSFLFCWILLNMAQCSSAVLEFANSQDYIQLFEDPRVSMFFLGEFVLNAMEYLYSGKSFFWIYLKSVQALDVLFVMMFLIVLFQDAACHHAKRMRNSAVILTLAFSLVLLFFTVMMLLASIQLTSEAGFSLLRTGAFYAYHSARGLILICLGMNVLLWIKKEKTV